MFDIGENEYFFCKTRWVFIIQIFIILIVVKRKVAVKRKVDDNICLTKS